MKILVLNSGSSSIKYQLFDMTNESVISKGIVDKIGLKGSSLTNIRNDGDSVKLEGEIVDHQAGVSFVLGVLISEKHGSIKNFSDINAVGHRVVHGAEKFKSSVMIDSEVIKQMEACIDLAPLHNPPNLKGIYAISQLLPDVKQVGVFDTAFHQTMPNYSYMYALPYSLYKKYGVRRYGFHGSSHLFVSHEACSILNENYNNVKIITCHLGNGASIAAIKNGKSIDTSMGMTPVEGLIMGTRSGDVDAGILTYIMEKEEVGRDGINTIVNKFSGMIGISGVSSDMRDIEKAAENKNERAILALKMYSYRIKKYIGAYAAAMGGVDIIVFTGGIGENAKDIRKEVCSDMQFLGFEIDNIKNNKNNTIISTENSNVKVMVVPTNEELVIARDTFNIVKEK